jgi:glycosyltransferase involved in cell wall biosynthesis
MIDHSSASNNGSFRNRLHMEFQHYVRGQAERFDPSERLQIDFHCHDRNSDVPDELWGRILGLPETWLETRDLVKCLRGNGCDVITVTNHNNARSCWELLDQGHDVLVGAEFTCHVPEYELYLHVLTYGFTPEQEVVLNKKRRNIYEFLRYAAEYDIPVILPHPLYFYTRNDQLSLDLFEKLALMFQRFEVLNGQRDLWQSVLVLNWARGLTEEKLERYARKHHLAPSDFGVQPWMPKVLTGGSDDHMGMAAGQSGSWLQVPGLQHRRKNTPLSRLALEAIREGRIAPYGSVGENQKLSVALLDYFAQIATRMEDPGLLRMMLHRGETSDKMACLAIANVLLEMKKHKKTQRYINFVHKALHGTRPNWAVRLAVSKDYRFCVSHLEKIADSHGKADEFAITVNDSIAELFTGLNQLIVKRARKCAEKVSDLDIKELSTESLIRKFEIPTQLTALAFGDKPSKSNISGLNVGELLDKLSFPVMVNLVLAGSQIASTRVLYANRQLLNDFSQYIGRNQHPKRALYLTDTLRDKNGVSNSLSGKLAEIQRRDYPVDFLICHADAEPEPHLHVVRPLAEVEFPSFGEQRLRIPDLLEIARIFYRGGYDRVVCSTEGPMVLVALLLKYMFNVPAFFFMHTDWLDFFKHTTNLDSHELDRIRRVMRALYLRFEGVFVLNSDHQKWLTSSQIGLAPEAVHLTGHHVERARRDVTPIRKSELIPGARDNTPVMFTACRISKEKGILELPEIYHRAKEKIPDLRIVIAGSGPAEAELKAALPEATFLGWVSRERIEQIYASLDLFVFPSKFDTFGNVILEAFSQGMPVLAYGCKGPKDIIEHGKSGYLVKTIDEMASQVVDHFEHPARHAQMRKAALRRVEDYEAGPIMQRFMHDLGLIRLDEQEQQQAAA